MSESVKSMEQYKFDDLQVETESQTKFREQEEEDEEFNRLTQLAASKAKKEAETETPCDDCKDLKNVTEDSDMSDQIEFEVCYQENDINLTRTRQQADLFKDVNTERTQILTLGNPAQNNFLDIASYAPEDEDNESLTLEERYKLRKERE